MTSKAGRKTTGRVAPRWVDGAVAGGILVFIVLLALFPIRNNDIWWHLAVGKRLLATRSFITEDPFTFTVAGTPWVPHAWLADIVLYLVQRAASTPGLVVLRALLVAATFAVLLRLVDRLRVSLVLAAPFVLIAALNIHSRFILRPHLFEYLFIAVLLAWLVTHKPARTWRFFLPPVMLQLLWVNMHASFYLGVGIVGLFYVGEWMARRLARDPTRHGLLDGDVDWWSAGVLLVAMALVSFVNPDPIAFVFQPLDAQQRELITRYALEWKSPFDPALGTAAFHPYYELLLILSALVFSLAFHRIRVASLLLVGVFALLSLKAHRFRVEFAIVAVPLVLEQLRAADVVQKLRKHVAAARGFARMWAPAAALAVSALLVVTVKGGVVIGGAVSDRFPTLAFDFVRASGVAQRSFHTVGFGSFLIWDLYPERRAFVDGRNVDIEVYIDFLACQTNKTGFNGVIRKYNLDAFIIPSLEQSDKGMRNLHGYLVESGEWSLVHIDRNAYVYVMDKTVPDAWLARNRFRFYHPLNFHRLRFSAAQVEAVESELERASSMDPLYVTPLLDTARFNLAMGNRNEAGAALGRVLEIDPDNATALELRPMLRPR